MTEPTPTRAQVLAYLSDEIARLEAVLKMWDAEALEPRPEAHDGAPDRARLSLLEAAVVYIGAPLVAPIGPMPLEPNPELEAMLLRLGAMARAVQLEPPTRIERFLRDFYALPYAVRAILGFVVLVLSLNLLVDLFN